MAKNTTLVNYRESKFGQTLLMLAINNDKYESAKALLEVGANPNLSDRSEGSNAVIESARNDDPRYLKLVLAYKGDPNSIEFIIDESKKKNYQIRNSALTANLYN